MLKIKDIMTREVFTVSPAALVDETAWALAVRGISGAPVRDGLGQIVGIISRSDLTDPERHPWAQPDRTVREVMTTAMLTLHENDLAVNAVRTMINEDIHRVVVVDDDGDLVGIVTPTDVLRAVIESESRSERPGGQDARADAADYAGLGSVSLH